MESAINTMVNTRLLRFVGALIGFLLCVLVSIIFAVVISDGGIYLALWVGLMIWGGGPELGATKLGHARSTAGVAFTPILSFIAPFIFLAVIGSLKTSLGYDIDKHINAPGALFFIIAIIANIIARAFVRRDYWLVFRIIFLPIGILWILIKGIFSKDSSSSVKSVSSPVATKELSEWDKKDEVQKQYEREQSEKRSF